MACIFAVSHGNVCTCIFFQSLIDLIVLVVALATGLITVYLHAPQVFHKYDADGDGKLSAEEVLLSSDLSHGLDATVITEKLVAVLPVLQILLYQCTF